MTASAPEEASPTWMLIRAGRHTMLWPLRVMVPVWTQSWLGQSEERTRTPVSPPGQNSTSRV